MQVRPVGASPLVSLARIFLLALALLGGFAFAASTTHVAETIAVPAPAAIVQASNATTSIDALGNDGAGAITTDAALFAGCAAITLLCGLLALRAHRVSTQRRDHTARSRPRPDVHRVGDPGSGLIPAPPSVFMLSTVRR